MLKGVRNWLDVRIGLDDLLRTCSATCKVPGNVNFFHTLGLVAVVSFLAQAATGIVLLFYYVPHTEHAFGSVHTIMSAVPYGWLFRSIHLTGGHLFVALLCIHLLSVLVMGSYRKPRELTWVVGILLLFLSVGFSFTGHLLAWSQLGYWTTTMMITMLAALPYAGELAASLLRGGDTMSGVTLGRFFAVHVGVLPLVFVSLAALHLFLVSRMGIATPPYRSSAGPQEPQTGYHRQEHPGGIPSYPHFVVRAAYAAMLYVALLFLLNAVVPTLFLTPDAAVPADPLRTPPLVRPDWYFLAAYQLYKLMPSKSLAVAGGVVTALVILLWPFLDTKGERNLLKRPLLCIVLFSAAASWLVLTIWGRY